MKAIYRVGNSLIFWRIMFFVMALMALGIYKPRPLETKTRTIIKREYIYPLSDDARIKPPVTEPRWM